MTVAVFGLGYVGCVSAACLAAAGHTVIGTDINAAKVDLINAGRSTIVEAETCGLIAEGVASGRLRATASPRDAVMAAEVSLICVGTPGREDGHPHLGHLRDACADIGQALAGKADYHVVAVRSTTLPGTLQSVVVPELEAASGLRAGEDFGVCSHPEFLREGTAVYDAQHPPYTLIGEWDPRAGDRVAALYAYLDAPVIRTEPRAAEMVKYASNAYHALKIAFVNEIGVVCKAHAIDSHAVMKLVALDTKLNTSDAYLSPGYAFGGSCLPKDLRALIAEAHRASLDVPVLDGIVSSNALQIRRGVDLVLQTGKTRIGVLGLSFKAGTDDLRESQMVALVRELLAASLDVRIFDEHVSMARVMGANRSFIEQSLPDLSGRLCDSLEEVVAHADVLVIGHRTPLFADVAARAHGRVVIDLARVSDDLRGVGAGYQGISW